MRREIRKGSELFCLFTRWWELFKELSVPEDKDEYWENLVRTLSDFANQYKGKDVTCYRLAKHLSVATINFIEEEYKERGKHE